MKTIALSLNTPDERIGKIITISATGLMMLLSLTSCKDDSESLPELKSTAFTSKTLALTYNGEEMPGKTVRLDYNSADNASGSASLSLYSEFDLSQLSGMGLTGSIPGPGVIPGSPTLSIPVNLLPGDGCYTFSGKASTEYAEFTYSGKLEDDLLTLNIIDGTLKSQIFAGRVFQPAPIVKEGLLGYSSLPFHLVWEIDPAIGVDLPLSDILKGIFAAPVIPVYNNTAYTSVAQMYCSAIRTVALTPGGNIPVVYVSSVGGAAHLATSCGNMLQYVPSGTGIRLYVNPLSALSQALVSLSKPQEDAEFVTKAYYSAYGSGLDKIDPAILNAMVKALIKAIQPFLCDGVPLVVAPTENGVDIYLDTSTSVEFLSSLLGDMLQQPAIAGALQSYLAGLQLPNISPEELQGVLTQLPAFLEKTTKLEVGLAFEKFNP